MPPPKYKTSTDKTLTKKQGEKGAYWNPSMSSFRSPSNPTSLGHKSGYHESAVTTDSFTFLKNAKANKKGGTHTLAKASSSRSFWATHQGEKVDSAPLEKVLNIADGFRTDTARTILAGPEGKVAGHSGSSVSTSGQEAAHDLLREAIIDILKTPPKTKGMTERAIASVFSAITITSMAPATLARKAPNVASLKDKGAKDDWEERRNESKLRLDSVNDSLNKDEQAFVRAKSERFIKRTVSNKSKPERYLDKKRPRSPLRERATLAPPPPKKKAKTSSSLSYKEGHYDSKLEGKKKATLAPPVTPKEIGFYITQPFKADRRSLK